MQDRNFDDIAEKFSRNIYGTTKGQLRQAILWQDLDRVLAEMGPQKLRVQASGGGVTLLVVCLITSSSSPASSCSLSITLIGPIAWLPMPCLIIGKRICSSFIIWLESSSCSIVRYFVSPFGTLGLSA